MEWPGTLVRARFIKRYKRFLADFQLEDGSLVTAHCANTGSMVTCMAPDAPALLTYHPDPSRKLAYSFQAIQLEDGWVGINTGLANGLVAEAIQNGTLAPLQGYGELRREQRYGENNRVDILLREQGRADCYVEVKNVTLLLAPGVVGFPDAVTARGARHLEALARLVDEGKRAVLVYCVQRCSALRVEPAEAFDPHYAETLRQARRSGLEVYAYRCDLDERGLRLTTELPLVRGENHEA